MSLCDVCASLDLSGTEKYYEARLGQWQHVLTRAQDGCTGCQFFIDLLTKYVTDRGSTSVTEFFTSENDSINRRYRDGHDFDPDIHKDELWISSMRLLYKPAEMVAAGGSRYTCDDLNLEICTLLPDHTGDSLLDIKRDVPTDPADIACFDLIKTWMTDCDTHGCLPIRETPLPRRVIEIDSNPEYGCKLVESEARDGKFAALSHRWGDVDVYKLTMENIQQLYERVPFDQLSRNCRDAVTVSRALGIRYLWIDALCVIQDDEADKLQQMKNMHIYYSNCCVLISADIAENANSGILQDRLVQYSPPMGQTRDRCLRPACLRWLNDVTYSPLSQRAYAVQERILAPRILHYTRRQMMWECAHGWKLEAAHEIDKEMGSGQPRYDKTFVQPLLSSSSNDGLARNAENTAKLLNAWYRSVQEISSAKMTSSSDKLFVISGVAAALDDGSLGEYVAGMWTTAIERSLMWSRVYRLLEKPVEYRAPSWSWASIDGAISMDPAILLKSNPEFSTRWMLEHGLRVLEMHIVRPHDSTLYTSVLPGSFIKVEGKCINLNALQNMSSTFRPTLALDTSNAFDCPCCRADANVVDTTGASAENIMSAICLLVQGEPWTNDQAHAEILILHPVQNEQDTYERVGMLRLGLDFVYGDDRFAPSYKGKTVEEEFWELGWQRKVLKLV